MNNNILLCLRCNHCWKTRRNKIPKFCPKCKSPYWNKKRRLVKKEEIDNLVKEIINTNKDIINYSGGEFGVRDEGGIYFSVYNFKNLTEKNAGNPIVVGAFIFNEFAKKHHFIDGNKRTAYAISKMTMLLMRCYLKINYKTALPFILRIAEYNSNITFKDIVDWLKDNCVIINEKDISNYLNQVLVDLIVRLKYDEK